jgi:phage protein D/phage baseplate assembly protein gpV
MIGSFYAPRFDIRISGLTLAADISNQVLSVTCDTDLDMAGMFHFVVRNANNQLIDSALFDMGKNVEIYMGYGNNLLPIMSGGITSVEPSFPESGPPTLRISGYDRSYKLRHNQPDREPFQFTTDSAIAAQVAVEAGLIPIVDPSPIYHMRQLKQSSSDMAFLKERARANFFDVYVHWDKLYFQFPRPQTQAYVLEWGKNLSSYSPRISSAGLVGLQVIRSYSEELAQTIVAFAMAADFNPNDIQERLGSAALDLLLSLGRRVIRKKNIETSIDALTVAKSIMQEILEGMYEGSGDCIGIPALRAGTYISIRNVGKRFSGTYRLRKVTHTIDESGYRTQFEVTQRSGTSFLPLLRKSVQETPSPNESEQFYGVAVAKVTNNSDEESLGRVKVSCSWLSDTDESDWVRCTTPMAGKQMGMYFLPEVGDEVLVAFEHGDLSNPMVIGSLWNPRVPPPATNSDGQDNIRLIKTKSGHTITLDDTRGSEKIVMQDKGGSQITMNQDGTVTVSAKKDLTLNTGGNVTINARQDLTLQAKNGTITLDAQNVNVTVQNTMDVSGG